ncbi:hypothetical protein [Synechococcus sp. CBW1002]|nr:hypothetical protein [Synechococcus sp. CBW1002]
MIGIETIQRGKSCPYGTTNSELTSGLIERIGGSPSTVRLERETRHRGSQ